MIQGKLNKQLADVSLLKQPFVKDPSKSVEAFLSDPEVRQMRIDAGVDIDSQEVISAVGKFNVF